MDSGNAIPCRRCLLAEYDPDGALLTVREMVEALPEELRADKAEYERRLAICRGCTEINAGTCGACGCYVEYRAAKEDSYCPHEKHFW